MNYFQKKICHIGSVMAPLLFNYYLMAATFIGISLLMVAPPSTADTVEATAVQIIDTSGFPAPDTSGIVYFPYPQDYFLVVDSEVNEMPDVFNDPFNAFKVDRNGILLDYFSTLSFSDEPTGVTTNPENNHCFFSDDNYPRRIHQVDPGNDGICLTSDDIVTSFVTKNNFGSNDPEDVTYGLNSLFIVDGVADRVYRLMPGPNGVYDNVVTGDDLVSSFDTSSLGVTDPEGIVFDPTNNSLFIVGSQKDVIIQVTITGELLRTIDLSAINPNRPAGLALAPSSIDSSITSIYMVVRGEDNDDFPDENDGMIYELMIPPLLSENQAPIVSAGDDQLITLPNTAQLSGIVSDDNQPSSTYTTTWSKYSGLGEVSFTDPHNPSTLASFSTADAYVLRLTADDGELSAFDDLSIITMSPRSSPDIRNVPSDYPTIEDALSSAVPGDTIVLAPGTYQINETLYINKNNISIVSNFVTSGDENDIDTTILKGDPAVRLIDGVLGQSANLKLIGLTIIDAQKGVTFTDDYGEVHYCKFYNTQEDAISFDTNAGGAVTHTRVENAGDDSIDIDTRYNGSFLIAYNELINSDDDSIEIHLYNSVSAVNMHYDIHDNLFSGSGEDGIQLIDFDTDSKRTFDIYRNTFTGMPDVAIGSMFEGTAENFQGTAMTERVRIYNNYFYNNGYHITGGDNMIILNNIFEAATSTAIKRAKGASITDYNLFYNNPADTEDTLTGSNNLFDTNPQRNSDFTLQQGSPAIDAGTASYSHLAEVVLQIPTNEYTGQNPDIGRYEYALNNTAPVITLFGANPMPLNLYDTFTDPGATATDDVDGNLTADIQIVSDVDTSAVGSYTVTYTVTDSDDNTVSITRTVTVNNGTPGLSFLQSRVSASADDAEEDPDGSVYLNSSDLELIFDKQAQTVGIRFTNLAIPENAVISNAYIQFKVDETDFLAGTQLNIAGESTNNAQTFTNTPFNISNRSKTSSSVLWSPVAWNIVGASGGDQRTSDLTSIVQEIVSGTGWNSGNAMAFIITGPGKRVAEAYDGDQEGAPLLYVEYTTDANAIAPVLTLLGSNPITLNLGETFTDPGATAVDNEDGDLTTDIQIVSDVNTNAVGTYTVTYTVTDSDDNSASASRSVVVRDNTIAPVLTVNGNNPINLNLGETFTDPGATAVDNEDGDLTTDIQIVSDVNTSAVGTYTVTYTVTDSDDNSVSASRSVVVSDNGLSPVLTLLGANPIKINIGETFTDLGATAMDNEDGDLSSDIQIVSDVNTSAAGTYTITYTVTDSDDNSVSIIRSVIVSDGTAQLTSLQSRVSASANDAEENPDGSLYLNSSDLELVLDTQVQTVGLRFTNLAIPANAVISSAYIQFKVDETDFVANTQLNIAGESTNNAQIFTNTPFNISNRSKTSSSVLWSPVAWNTVGASGGDQRSSDLTSIVQEIVSGAGWNSGNAMVFIITGAGKRVAEAYDGDQAGAPLLYLEYTTDVNAVAPVLTLAGANPTNLNLGETFLDLGATAVDNEDGDLTADIQTVSDVNTSAVGTYTVTYTVTDSDDNSASITRSVVVTDPAIDTNILNVPSDYATIQDALANAVEGNIILLAPGTYNENEIDINKNNITIASKYLTTGDQSYIDNTIIQGDRSTYFITGLQGQSRNLKIIGLTIRESLKAITFHDANGEVHYCKIYDTGIGNNPGEADSIGFDKNAGGGTVTHCLIDNSRDDGIDIDAEYNSGEFVIAYNIVTNSQDDGMEIRLFPQDNVSYVYDIHDNLWSGSQEDGIQLIDYDGNNASSRTFNIYRNTFVNSADVGLGTMENANTIENFNGTAIAERINLHNNYFYNNRYHITGGDNMIILNNIFEAATTTAIYRAKVNSITDYNIFYNNQADTVDTLIGTNNLFGSDPQRNSDFTLQTGSPAIDAGTASYNHLSEVVLQIPSSEYAGSNPDIGRYESTLNGTAPVLTLLGSNPRNLNLNEAFTDQGATALDNEDGDLTADIEIVSTVDTTAVGSYTVTYIVTDSDDNTASITRSVIVSDGTVQLSVLQSRVSASADDAEENLAGSVYLNSSDLELIFDKQAQTVGLRFTNLAIPANAIISNAYIQFKVDETDSLANTQLNIAGESTNNAQIFSSAQFNISNRSKTSSSVLWSPIAWNTVGASGGDQRTSDLTSIVQEIVSGTGWSSGNAMAFIITGAGKRVAEAYDGDQAGAPLLYIEYTD